MLLRVALVSVLTLAVALCQEAPPQDPTPLPSRVKVTPSSPLSVHTEPPSPTGPVLENVPDTKDTTQEASTAATTRSSAEVEEGKGTVLSTAASKDETQDVPLALRLEATTVTSSV